MTENAQCSLTASKRAADRASKAAQLSAPACMYLLAVTHQVEQLILLQQRLRRSSYKLEQGCNGLVHLGFVEHDGCAFTWAEALHPASHTNLALAGASGGSGGGGGRQLQQVPARDSQSDMLKGVSHVTCLRQCKCGRPPQLLQVQTSSGVGRASPAACCKHCIPAAASDRACGRHAVGPRANREAGGAGGPLFCSPTSGSTYAKRD